MTVHYATLSPPQTLLHYQVVIISGMPTIAGWMLALSVVFVLLLDAARTTRKGGLFLYVFFSCRNQSFWHFGWWWRRRISARFSLTMDHYSVEPVRMISTQSAIDDVTWHVPSNNECSSLQLTKWQRGLVSRCLWNVTFVVLHNNECEFWMAICGAQVHLGSKSSVL